MANTQEKIKPPFHNLVIEGGGAKNIACLGAIRFLEEKNYLDSITKYAGSSAGSLIALFLLLGYNSKQIYQLIVEQDLKKIMKSNWLSIPFNLLMSYGLNKPNKFIKLLQTVLKNKGFKPTITFKELHDQTNKVLVITGTNITKRKTDYFSHIHWPNLPVLDAIQASINVPLYFTKHQINGDYYIDGGLLMNFPLYYFDKYDETQHLCCDSTQLPQEFPDPVLTSTNKTLGILTLDTSDNINHHEYFGNQEINSLYEYISSTIHTLLHTIEQSTIRSNYWNRSIAIQLPYEIGITNFQPPKHIQQEFWTIGYVTAKKFF